MRDEIKKKPCRYFTTTRTDGLVEIGGLDRALDIVYITRMLYNNMVNQKGQTDPLTLTFSALADPTRRAILERLAAGRASVKELAAPFQISQPAVSRHLKVLEHAGLIARGRDAQWRPAQLQAQPLKDVSAWVERYRANWEESYQRLDEYLSKVQAVPLVQKKTKSSKKRRNKNG